MNLDVLLEPVPEMKKAPCLVGRVLAEMPAEIREQVANGLATPLINGGMSDEQWADRFRRAELPIGVTTLNRHRRGVCVCA